MLRKLTRSYEMLRHVPSRQIVRRLELNMRRRLTAYLPYSADAAPPPPLADRLPLPLLPVRPWLTRTRSGWRLRQPWGSLDLPNPIDWRLGENDPATMRWRSNLHYMEYLEGVDDEALVELVSDWIAANPKTARDAWRCAWWSYNLSIRVVVWMQQIAARKARLQGHFVVAAAASLAQQLRFLERHLETDIHGNHLIRNTRALLWAGAFFVGPEAERWRRKGERLLDSELTLQILSDGGHYERSPSYHCQVFGDLLEIAAVLEHGPRRDRLLETLDRMAHVCACLTHPDGTPALFNDGGIDLAYRPTVLLEAHARLRGHRVSLAAGVFAFPEIGYYGLRSDDGYCLVDCGPIGPDELIGHGHGDILSFEWSIGGRRIIVDQGTYQYRDGPLRRQSRSTYAHNTVSIAREDQCDFFGAHRCGRRARISLLNYMPTTLGFSLEGTHDGFERLPGGPSHIRRFAVAPDSIEIEDRLIGTPPLDATAGLLLHPDCRVHLTTDGATIENGPVVITLDSSVAPTLEAADWFPNLYVKQPATRLRFAVDDTHVLRTVLRRRA